MGKPSSCTQFIKSRISYYKSRENPYQYCKSRENPYQVLQVTCAASERAMKSKVHDKIIITIVPSYIYQKKYHSFVAVGIVTRAAHS